MRRTAPAVALVLFAAHAGCSSHAPAQTASFLSTPPGSYSVVYEVHDLAGGEDVESTERI